MEKKSTRTEFSLLFPPDRKCPSKENRWGEKTIEDLEIDQVAWNLSIDNKYHEAVKSILLELCSDIETITYRQEVLEDFLKCQAVFSGMKEIMPLLTKLHDHAEARSRGGPLQETLGRLTELNTYILCVRKLQGLLEVAGSEARSRGLAMLNLRLANLAEDATFQSLEKGLPELLAKMNTIPSITIGINLDSELRPVEAALLAIHDKPFRDQTLFDQLLGKKNGQNPAHPIGPIHKVPELKVNDLMGRIVSTPNRADPLLVPLFKDLYEILRAVLAPVSQELNQYAQVNARLLIRLESEIAFYLGAVAFIRQMQAEGLPVCSPQASPAEERICSIQGMYNPILALHLLESEAGPSARRIVLNDVDFGSEGRIFILTGPNQGGKTVYTQAVGLAQVLFQAGIYIPAKAARISPVDGIYTHFATLEKTEEGVGRLAEEARRLNEIFHSISDKSLVLLNESLSSTSPGESLYLARDVVQALRLFEARAIFATHLHGLGEGLDAINAEGKSDSRVASLVSGVAMEGDKKDSIEDSVSCTYEIKPGPPRGLSYAKGIAVRYGISLEQLTQLWNKGQQ
jgi:DNA mismatch repair protein MutS